MLTNCGNDNASKLYVVAPGVTSTKVLDGNLSVNFSSVPNALSITKADPSNPQSNGLLEFKNLDNSHVGIDGCQVTGSDVIGIDSNGMEVQLTCWPTVDEFALTIDGCKVLNLGSVVEAANSAITDPSHGVADLYITYSDSNYKIEICDAA